MGTQIEHTNIWHINIMFMHGEKIVHTIIGIMQWMGWIEISYILGDLDALHPLHDFHDCLHHMHSMNNNALDISHDALHNLSLHYAIHNNKPLMMDGMFLYHASHLFEHLIFCANRHMHVRIMMDDVYIYHAHTISSVCVSFV